MRSTTDPVGTGRSSTTPSRWGSVARASCTADAIAPTTALHPVARDRRDHETAGTADRRTGMLPPGGGVGGRHQVGLGADHEPRPVEQLGPVAGQLVEQHPFLLGRRHAVERGEVDQQAQHAGPLDVAEELVPEPTALARPLDQPGDVGDDELVVVVEAHHAEVGLERRERVVGDLRLGRRDDADQRALADVREPDQGDVGHQPDLQLEPALLAVLALLGERRRPAAVGEEAGRCPVRRARRRRPATGRRGSTARRASRRCRGR